MLKWRIGKREPERMRDDVLMHKMDVPADFPVTQGVAEIARRLEAEMINAAAGHDDPIRRSHIVAQIEGVRELAGQVEFWRGEGERQRNEVRGTRDGGQ